MENTFLRTFMLGLIGVFAWICPPQEAGQQIAAAANQRAPLDRAAQEESRPRDAFSAAARSVVTVKFSLDINIGEMTGKVKKSVFKKTVYGLVLDRRGRVLIAGDYGLGDMMAVEGMDERVSAPKEISVLTPRGEPLPALFIDRDAVNDLAVVQVTERASDLKPINLESARLPRRGETAVIVIGNRPELFWSRTKPGPSENERMVEERLDLQTTAPGGTVIFPLPPKRRWHIPSEGLLVLSEHGEPLGIITYVKMPQPKGVRRPGFGYYAVLPPAYFPKFDLPGRTPRKDEYRLYWGDVHGHTRHSDGKGSLDDYFTYARDTAGLDFVIVTDHDFGNAAPWRMPEKTWTLIQDKADEYTADGRFVAIAGYEWTSQRKYWTEAVKFPGGRPLFSGPPKSYNHKNVYFPSRVEYIFSAKDPAYKTPDLLAEAVKKHGGLIQNNHPDSAARDQWDYAPRYETVITNTEILPDVQKYKGKTFRLDGETIVRRFLDRGGKTGFVKGTDTHEGKPEARTAVLARELTREGIFEALRHRRNYAVSNARIVLDFRIQGHLMGEEIEIDGKPRITADVHGTDKIREIALIRDGSPLYSTNPGEKDAAFEYVDETFEDCSYYYLRVTQVDADEDGNPSRAWASPIWVRKKAKKKQ